MIAQSTAMRLSAANDIAAGMQAPRAIPVSLVGQGLALLCWTAMLGVGVAAWRRRRGNDFPDLLTAGGLWLAARLGTCAVGLPRAGQPRAGWLMLALDLGGLVLLAWPFLSPPLSQAWADRLAGIGFSAVAVGCGISVWQGVRGTLGLSLLPQITIPWAYSALVLAGLAALHLLHAPARQGGRVCPSGRGGRIRLRPARLNVWGLTVAGALTLGTGGLLSPVPTPPWLCPVLTAFAATLAACLLNWLEHTPQKSEPAPPSNGGYHQEQGTRQAALANLRECNRQLAEQIQHLQDLDRLKSDFLTHMSHELRAPLNSVVGFSGLMLKGMDGRLTDTQHQDVEAIHNSSKHLLRLINEMLEVSQVWMGEAENHRAEMSNLPIKGFPPQGSEHVRAGQQVIRERLEAALAHWQ